MPAIRGKVGGGRARAEGTGGGTPAILSRGRCHGPWRGLKPALEYEGS